MNCVMACECHDDMDMLIEHMEHAQDNLQKLLSVVRDRLPKIKDIERYINHIYFCANMVYNISMKVGD